MKINRKNIDNFLYSANIMFEMFIRSATNGFISWVTNEMKLLSVFAYPTNKLID